MDLSFNEAQRAIKTTARDFFQANCPISLVRELEGRAPGYSPDMWRKMAGLQWLGITLPERYEGSGERFLTQYVLYEEMGRFIVPSPHLGTAVLGAETVLRAGSEDQKRRLLPAIARGELFIAPAMTEPSGAYGPEGVDLPATAQGSGYRLNGTKLLVPYADSADYILCPARTRKGADPAQGTTLFLVERKTPGIAIEPIPNISGERLCAVTFDNVTVPQSAVLGKVDQGWQAIRPALDRASVLVCAMVCGASERVLEMAVNYAKERVQFGRPVGGFQAVQYLCTDVAIDGAQANLLSKQAAWLIDEDLPHDREAAIAKAAASRAAHHMTRQAMEVHAGVAFMEEHDLQLYTRRAKGWEVGLGDMAYHQEAMAVALGL